MKRTTDLTSLKNGAPFTWGQIIAIQEIGEYTIVSCFPQEDIQGSSGEIRYHGYIQGKPVNECWDSLDEALAGVIAVKHDGPNTQAHRFFIKMVSH